MASKLLCSEYTVVRKSRNIYTGQSNIKDIEAFVESTFPGDRFFYFNTKTKEDTFQLYYNTIKFDYSGKYIYADSLYTYRGGSIIEITSKLSPAPRISIPVSLVPVSIRNRKPVYNIAGILYNNLKSYHDDYSSLVSGSLGSEYKVIYSYSDLSVYINRLGPLSNIIYSKKRLDYPTVLAAISY